MFQISNEDGPSLDSLPTEVLQLIYHHLHNGLALSRACLVSRRLKAALWDNDHLWHEAFECDWGRLATTAVELHGTAQKPTDGAQNPQVQNWRSLYAAHHSFVGRVHQERERKSAARLVAKRDEYESEARRQRRERIQRQGRPMYTFKLCSPLLPLVILPALLVLLILRAEAVITWSFHLVFIPADFLSLFGCWFLVLLIRKCNSRELPFIISCGVACLAAIPTLHWAAARGDWIAAHGNRPSTGPGNSHSILSTASPASPASFLSSVMRAADTPGGLNWMGIFAPMLACCIAYTVFLSLPLLHRPRILLHPHDCLHDCHSSPSPMPPRELSLGVFLLSGLPLMAFLALLGYKLQWGGPGFLYTYAFIPLFLYPIGLQIGLISALKRSCSMIALTTVVVVMPLTATLILIVLRLDWTVHTAFIAIPTAFWLLPLVVVTLVTSGSTWSEVRTPEVKISVRSLTTLSNSEKSAIEEQLTEAFGPHIYRADDERMLLNSTGTRPRRDADHGAQEALESIDDLLERGRRDRLLVAGPDVLRREVAAIEDLAAL
ncbi:hypothetical protein PAPYR_2761 [Paratrimastix pyriformis]|uniref:F-box domain-containing protein n=1 Tax=Paratrimastix pyriformis TaxID=342808 RepID=A0ABQ8UP32_9EUKA|nr:hypothetical protein PAPYR_2761 [Paratrimastix pyriformis]